MLQQHRTCNSRYFQDLFQMPVYGTRVPGGMADGEAVCYATRVRKAQ